MDRPNKPDNKPKSPRQTLEQLKAQLANSKPVVVDSAGRLYAVDNNAPPPPARTGSGPIGAAPAAPSPYAPPAAPPPAPGYNRAAPPPAYTNPAAPNGGFTSPLPGGGPGRQQPWSADSLPTNSAVNAAPTAEPPGGVRVKPSRWF